MRPYLPTAVDSPAFLARAQSAEQRGVRIRAALPDGAETQALTGLDLYAQGIQPLWLEISNDTNATVHVAHWSIDRDYFSPIEVAYMNRRPYSKAGYAAMERWFRNSSLPRRVPPGETRSGFVYTNLTPGTKGFNLDLFSVAEAFNFTFFLDLPGFVPDYRLVNLEGLYSDQDLVKLRGDALARLLADEFPCCATDASGQLSGRPLNLVLVGTARALRRSLLRGAWRETAADERQRLAEGQDHFDGRAADGRFYLTRDESDVSLVLNIWLSPLVLDGQPVWVAQAFYSEGSRPLIDALRRSSVVERSRLLARFIGETVAADIDSAATYALQNFWYNQSVSAAGFVRAMDARTVDDPGTTFDGLGYITRGYRAVVVLSEEPVSFADAQLLFGALEEPSRQVREGQ